MSQRENIERLIYSADPALFEQGIELLASMPQLHRHFPTGLIDRLRLQQWGEAVAETLFSAGPPAVLPPDTAATLPEWSLKRYVEAAFADDSGLPFHLVEGFQCEALVGGGPRNGRAEITLLIQRLRRRVELTFVVTGRGIVSGSLKARIR